MRITIVLDLDDTLYPEETYVRSGIAAVSDWAEREMGIQGIAAEADALRSAGITERLFDRALANLGVAPRPALVAALVAEYRSHRPDISLAADAEEFLRGDHGFGFALVTDGYQVAQRRKIEALGLDRFAIDPIICTDDWGRDYWKPHPRAFEAVEASRSNDRCAFLYVADNPAKDFVAPRALGWRTVQIDRPGAIHVRTPPTPDHRADLLIHSFAELTRERVEHLLGTTVLATLE